MNKNLIIAVGSLLILASFAVHLYSDWLYLRDEFWNHLIRTGGMVATISVLASIPSIKQFFSVLMIRRALSESRKSCS